MITQRFLIQANGKGFLVLFVILLAFLIFGIVGHAAPVEPAYDFHEGGTPVTLICSNTPTEAGLVVFCNVQIVLLIDDSGSMKSNDPQNSSEGGLRNQGARNLVDLLATQYYLPIVRLKEADTDQDIELPVVQVAVVHFTEKLLNKDDIKWVTIDPNSLDEWNEQKDQQGGINDLINLNYLPHENTSFKEPFEKALELFNTSRLDEGCGLRSIMLFTDGAPYDSGRLMKGQKLNNHMGEVKGSVNAINADLPDDEKVQVYITGFNQTETYLKYWNEDAEPAWWNVITDNERIIEEKDNEPRKVQLLGGEDYLTQLASRMEAITADLIGLQRAELTTDVLVIPKHVQAVRLTLFNLDPQASFVITDPDGNELIADGTNVIVSGEDSAIESWDLNLPAAGDYQVQATKPGGIITKLITYQNLLVEFVDLPDEFVVSEPADIKFKLFDSSGDVLLMGDPPSYTLELELSVTLGVCEPTILELNHVGDGFQTTWTPTTVGESQFRVEAKFISGDGDESPLLTCEGEVERPVYGICEPDCTEGFPIWLIFVFLFMWLVILLMGWVILRDKEINFKFWVLVILEFVLAVVWFILFSDYLRYLLWMLVLLAILVIFLLLIYRREIKGIMTWWLIILVTLFVSVWFIFFGGFPFWLIVLLLLMWIGILALMWIFSPDNEPDNPPRMTWFVFAMLLILAIVIVIYFIEYWIFLLVWLLVILIFTLIVRVIGPICPPTLIPDDLTQIEGIGQAVEQLLNDHGVYTFKELTNTAVEDLNDWLNAKDWDYMDPKTWPYQAELAEKAKVSGKKEDQEKFDEYKAWLKGGIARDEYNEPEDERSDEIKKPPEEEE